MTVASEIQKMPGVTAGKIKAGRHVLIYGPEGVGKTTFAAGAGRLRFLDLEKGSGDLDIAWRVMPETWDEVLAWSDKIIAGQTGGDYDTVVIDSATKLQALIHKHLTPTGLIEDFGEGNNKGYGRGDTASVNELRRLLEKCERLRTIGKNIVFTGHSLVKKFEDPNGPGWERYELDARPKFAGALKQWVGYTLFAQRETTLLKQGGKTKGTSTGARFIYTQWSAAYDAKARGELPLPEVIPMSWLDFISAVESTDARAAELKREIDAMLGEIADADYTRRGYAYLKSNPTKLAEAHNWITVRLAEVRSEREKEKKQ